MTSVCLLSLNNTTNYLLAKHIIEKSDLKIKCLVLDEKLELMAPVLEQLGHSERISLQSINQTQISNAELESLASWLGNCQFAFLDTHYWKHANPETERQHWKLLGKLFQKIKLTRLVICRYENTETFCQKDLVLPIGEYHLPSWDSRHQGLSYFTNYLTTRGHQIDSIIYLYPSLFYDQIISHLKPIHDDTGKREREYHIQLAIGRKSPLYAIDRQDYATMAYKILTLQNLEMNPIQNYKVSGEILDMAAITEMIGVVLHKKCHFQTQDKPPDSNNLIAREWFNYFVINEKYYKNQIIRDPDLTSFYLPNLNSFYKWLKQLPNWINLYNFRH